MITSETAERLAKMLPRLASEHDGEVVATVRAIGRTLAAAGADWHALAAVVAAPSPADTSGPIDWSAVYEAAQRSAANWSAAREAVRDPDAPDAPARKHGYPIWGTSRIEPWCTVAGHCLQIDWRLCTLQTSHSQRTLGQLRLAGVCEWPSQFVRPPRSKQWSASLVLSKN